MHELAIADAIARIAREHAAGRPVRLVRVRIGHLRQVVPSALRFGFELIAQGTPLDGAALAIEAVPAAARCRACGAETPQPRFPLACRACGSLAVTVVCGEELYVESLEVEDATDRAETGRERRRAAAEPARSLP